MKDQYEAPPSYEDLEPEGEFSVSPAVLSASQGSQAGQVPLESIEEDYLDDADWFEEDTPPRNRTTKRMAKKRGPRPKVQRSPSPRQALQVADWDEEFDAEFDTDDYSDDMFGEDDSDAFDSGGAGLEDDLYSDDALVSYTDPSSSSNKDRDTRAASLREDERLLIALAEQLQQAQYPVERAAFMGALVPLALRAHPQVYGALTPHIPSLIRTLLTQRRGQSHVRGKQFLKLLLPLVHKLAAKAARGETLSAKHVRIVAGSYKGRSVNKKERVYRT